MDFPLLKKTSVQFYQSLVELMPHLPEASAAIKILVEELKQGNAVNYNNIRILVSQLYQRTILEDRPVPQLPQNSADFAIFLFKIIELMMLRKYSDKSVIADILQFILLMNYESSFEEKYINWIYLRYRDINAQMSMFEKCLVFSYKDIPSLVPPISPFQRIPPICDWVHLAAKNGNIRLLKSLILFGATLIAPRDNPCESFQACTIMKLLFVANEDAIDVSAFDCSVQHNLRVQFNEISRLRLFFVIMILQVFVSEDFEEDSDTYSNCARVLINLTPEPLITSGEIQESFGKLGKGIISEELLLQFVEKYKHYFPESKETSTPSSLKHLSRFHVIERLRIAKTFPNGIHSLCVPHGVKAYIFLTWVR